MTRHGISIALGCAILVSACTTSTSVRDGGSEAIDGEAAAGAPTEPPATTGAPSATDPAPDGTSSTAPPTSVDAPTTTAPTTAPATTTTTTVPGPDVYDPNCVVEVGPGDSLGLISEAFDDPTVYPDSLRAENDIEGDVIHPGDLIDTCVDNGLDDVTGDERAPNAALQSARRVETVKAQQVKLNELFDGLGIRPLAVDGISGPVTRQRLCAARIALGVPVTLTDMEAGSEEEQKLMSTEQLHVPFTSSVNSERWILIDRTCQIMYVGERADRITFVFPTSTGEEGFETRDQDRTPAFRYDPALDNGGWHNSTDYPVPEDNPLNGNMYRPLYFDNGQAIHGANNVPRSPASKGCARLRVEDQDKLVGWLGLADASGPTNDRGRINVTVNVQGRYVSS